MADRRYSSACESAPLRTSLDGGDSVVLSRRICAKACVKTRPTACPHSACPAEKNIASEAARHTLASFCFCEDVCRAKIPRYCGAHKGVERPALPQDITLFLFSTQTRPAPFSRSYPFRRERLRARSCACLALSTCPFVRNNSPQTERRK